MTKSELIEAVANTLKLPKGKAELIVNCVFDSMEAALKRGERIEIRGFGSFEIRHYKAYKGRNPRTGAEVDVRPKRLPFFKVGKELKERVNEGAEAAAAGTPVIQPAEGVDSHRMGDSPSYSEPGQVPSGQVPSGQGPSGQGLAGHGHAPVRAPASSPSSETSNPSTNPTTSPDSSDPF